MATTPGRWATATVISHVPAAVSVRVVRLPAHAWATLKPSRLRWDGRSRLKVRIASATRPGVYLVVVSGIDRSRRYAARLSVIVRKPRFPVQPSPQSVPTHIETWAYDDGCNGGVGASASFVRQWLTYAESNCGPMASDSKILTDCHADGRTYCSVMAYLDPNHIYSPTWPIVQDTQESWWLHEPGYTDSAHRLVDHSSDWGDSYLLNDADSAVDEWYQNWVRASYPSVDGLLIDEVAGSARAQFYGTGYTSTEEIPDDAAVLAEHERMAAALTRTDGSAYMQVDNGLGPNPYQPTDVPLLNGPGDVAGLFTEGNPYDNGTLTTFYSTLLDDMAYVDQETNDFLVLLSYDSAGSLRGRRVQAATVLLGYSPGHIVSWPDLEQNSGDLAIWPEEGLYSSDPIQTMGAPGGPGCLQGTGEVCPVGGHNDVQVATGVYRREFRSCYDQGTPIGGCAVVMNDTAEAVTVQRRWLTLDYQHQITMNGGDVQSGGSLDVSDAPFSAGTTVIPADDAILLAA